MTQPLITVGIPLYNHVRFIGAALESVLSQGIDSLEVIVLDNASTDGSAEVVRHYLADSRVRLIVHPASIGATNNIQRCAELARGRYFAWLHSDDVLRPGHLAELINALELHQTCALAYCRYERINDEGTVVDVASHPGLPPHSCASSRDELVALLSYDTFIAQSAAVMRRANLIAALPLDAALGGAIDWDLWCRMAAVNPNFVFIERPSIGYRIHGAQDSNRFYASPWPLLDHLAILEKFISPDYRGRLAGHEGAILRLLEQRVMQYKLMINDDTQERLRAVRNALHVAPSPMRDPVIATADQPCLRDTDKTSLAQSTQNEPLVTTIITTFNRPELLMRALRSVLQQSYRNIEIIVVNDCGEQVENLIASASTNANVQYIRHGINRGQGAARNTALRCARGEIITYLDDDDLYLPDHVATVVEALRDTAHDFVYTESVYVTEQAARGEMHEITRRKQFDDCSYSKERLFVANFIPLNTWGHRRQVFEQIGGFDESLGDHEDWDFLMRAASRQDLRHVATVTVEVRHRTLADNWQAERKKNFCATFAKLYERHGDLGSTQVADGRARMLASLAESTKQAEPPRSAQSIAPWLIERRAMPIERSWADEAVHGWSTTSALPRLALLLVAPHPTLVTRPTLHSVKTQWYEIEAIPSPAAGADLLQPINQALIDAHADWVGLIDTGDTMPADASFRILNAILSHPEWQLVYTDEDTLTPDGQHINPHCKPDFNLDYLRSLPYIGGLLLIRRDLFEALGGFDPAFEGAEDYDLLLRAWEHLQATGVGEKAIGHVAEVLYHRAQGSGHSRKSVPEILAAGQSALQAHFQRLGIAAEVQPGPFPPSYRVRWPLPEVKPLVSILVPTRNQLGFLQRCVESVIEKTKYPAYELIVIDNDSDDADTCRYLDAIESREAELAGRLRVLRQPGPFNFSAMNNAAARTARGDYLLLLNNDTAALHDDWLDEMMGHALRPDVGIVGAKLLYPDGKIQHAGVILGMRGPAEHPFISHPPEDRGYFGRAQLVQDLSAVTGACLLVRKSVYEQVGGLDENDFKVSYNDIDLCLKVRESGLRIVFTPFALLLHEGSASQKGKVETAPDEAKLKRFAAEKDAMYRKWLPALAFDPAYNRHLSLASTDFLLDDQPCLSWDPEWRPRPRILVHPADREGCGEYRIISPMRALNRAGMTQGWETMRLFEPAEMQRMDPDVLVVQRQMEWPQIEAIERHGRYHRAFRVFEIDDLITNLPVKSVHKKQIHKDIAKRFRKAAGLCHRLVVATEPLAQAYAGFADEVVVCPNHVEGARWSHLQPARAERARPRVGWAGGIGHTGDLELIAEVVRDTANEIDWVFFGMCPDSLKGVVKEFHPGVPLDQYAAKLAALDLDLAVAPLEDNPFNDAKSHLRLLEYGILGYPVICSDLAPYQGDFPVTRVVNRYRDWMRAIREAVSDRDALRAQGDALRDKVRAEWVLEDHLDRWMKAWTP